MNNKNVERGLATRAHLIDVATRLFVAHGYEGTSIEAVLAESGASRGSLYHHFPGKEALFLAVMEDVGNRFSAQVQERMQDIEGPVAELRAGLRGWIRLGVDPVARQVLLIDAPAVLGWQRWRELDQEGPLGVLKTALAAVAEAGNIDPRHVDTFAHIVMAAANEVSLMIALADDPDATLSAEESAFTTFLDRLLAG